MFRCNVMKSLDGSNGRIDLNISLEVEAGSRLLISGESGSGKTTLLRCIAGLDSDFHGQISLDGQTWFDSRGSSNVDAAKRPVAMMWPGWTLFPHWNIRQNIEAVFSPKTRESQRIRMFDLLERMGIAQFASCKPSKLSTGQIFRAGIIQMLCTNPKVFLMDEGLGNLDEASRRMVLDIIRTEQEQHGFLWLMASHVHPGAYLPDIPEYQLSCGELQPIARHILEFPGIDGNRQARSAQ